MIACFGLIMSTLLSLAFIWVFYLGQELDLNSALYVIKMGILIPSMISATFTFCSIVTFLKTMKNRNKNVKKED